MSCDSFLDTGCAGETGAPHAWSGLTLGPAQPGPEPGTGTRELLGAWLRPARGRWLRLALALPAATPELRLVVRGADGHWPDVAIALQVDAGGAWAWVFIGERVGGLFVRGALEHVAALHEVTATLADEPPAEAVVPVEMRTAAALHRMGVRGMREVEFSDDDRWPLRAVGDDPQLRFLHLDASGRVRVEVELAAEGDRPAAPRLYWTDGPHGFDSRSSRACEEAGGAAAHPGARRYSAGLPLLRRGGRWRLDPLHAPGRFRLDAVRVQRTGASPWMQSVRRCLAWLAALRPTRRIAELVPAKDVQPLGYPDHRFVATSDDPQMRLERPLSPGWYMLELRLDLPGARGRARVYLDDGHGETEANAFSLPLRSGRVAKRLLRVQSRAHLRLDPVAAAGEFTLSHFRLQRVSRGFALGRLRQKLANARSAPRCTAAGTPDELEPLWQAYCNVFEPHHEGAISYADWIADVEQPALPSAEEQAARMSAWSWMPVVSIVTPTYDTPLPLLAECLDSVLAQTYPHWELCIADDASPNPAVRALLAAYAARDPRIKLCLRERNGHISQASNSALELATGDFVALLDHDDTLAPHALFAVVEALQARPSARIVYSDEDKLDADGRRCEPFFKPDWSPDLLRSQNYVSHLGVYRRETVEAVGRFREGFQGSQDYDLLLRCVARLTDPDDVVHVPQVLYHWRKTEGSTAAAHEQKPYATEAARRALQEHADNCTPGATVSVIAPGLYRHRWPIPDPAPLVSLIVPTRDGLDVLRNCIDSILQRTTYPHYEIVVVDNQSSEPQTLAYLEQVPGTSGGRVRVLRYDHPFNYAAINNFAADHARGSVLGLVNNDVEVITPEWLTEMTSHAVRPEIGCVGAKLYFPDDTVQHAGVVLGIGGVAGHSHKYFDRSHDGYFSRLRIVHNVSAVTGAVMLVRKAVFDAVGGLDAAHLHVAFNDVDFCLKVQAAGWTNLLTPFAELYHHESKTRGTESTVEKRERFASECRTMQSRWGDRLARDPFYNPNLTLVREDYSICGDRHSDDRLPKLLQSLGGTQP